MFLFCHRSYCCSSNDIVKSIILFIIFQFINDRILKSIDLFSTEKSVQFDHNLHGFHRVHKASLSIFILFFNSLNCCLFVPFFICLAGGGAPEFSCVVVSSTDYCFFLS